jgi:hypothetical protein
MNTLRPNERMKLLSQYLDGAVTEEERRRVEDLLARDAEARKELADLKALAAMMGERRRLEPDIGFWTRLSVKIQEEEQEERSLLPFPRRFVPLAATAATAVIAVVGILVMQNRVPVLEFFSKQSQAVKEVYEQSVMKGSILPLFASVDKDRALQFSLFGELSLDAKSQTALRVDQNSQSGYRIEVGKQSKRKNTPVTFDRFVREVNPTPVQRRVIDSLLRFAQDRIASAVLVGEDNALAIDPNLPQLSRVMVTGIASCLEPPQRKKLERLLAVHEAPYAVSMEHVEPAMEPQEVYSRLPAMTHSSRFMVVTPDTAVYLRMEVDFDSLRRMMEMDMRRFEEQREALFQRLESGQFRRVMRPGIPPLPRSGGVDRDFLRIEFGAGPEGLQKQVNVMVAPRPRRAPMSADVEGEVHIRIFQGPDGQMILENTIQQRATGIDTGGAQHQQAVPKPVPAPKPNPID